MHAAITTNVLYCTVLVVVGGMDRLTNELGTTKIYFGGDSMSRLSGSWSDPFRAHFWVVTIDNTLFLVGGRTDGRRNDKRDFCPVCRLHLQFKRILQLSLLSWQCKVAKENHIDDQLVDFSLEYTEKYFEVVIVHH